MEGERGVTVLKAVPRQLSRVGGTVNIISNIAIGAKDCLIRDSLSMNSLTNVFARFKKV